jgi:hypothetical protein
MATVQLVVQEWLSSGIKNSNQLKTSFLKKSNMKHITFSFIFFICVQCSNAQNIGIGTTTPSAKLTVQGNELTPNGEGAAIKIQNTSSTNAWYMRAGGNGTFTPLGGFSFADNIGYHFTMAQGGNIGLGILPTAARLHVNGEIRMQGVNVFEFGAGVAGKEVNAGKVGYNAFGTNALTFVGGGTTNLNRSIFFFAEGGTTMNGPLNFNGPLRVNGNPGTAGQVLTSNGTNTAEWSNSSFSNNVRFAVSFTTPATFGSDNNYNVIYNNSSSDVTITPTVITINKSGLYHFEGDVTGTVNFTTVATFYNFTLSFLADGIFFIISNGDEMPRISSTTLEFSKTLQFSKDFYISAPAIIRPQATVGVGSGGSGITRSASGRITGYLISE